MKEKVREGIFFNAVKRAKRIRGRDEEDGFQSDFRGKNVLGNFPKKQNQLNIKL
jgi:hypothetical protein